MMCARYGWKILGGLFVMGLLSLLMSACRSPQPVLQPGEIQAEWGRAIYQMECAHCHNPTRVVPLTVARLVPYRNAENLFQYIRETMPLDEPGSLPDYDYWAVTAYLLAAADTAVPTATVLGPETAASVGFTHE